MKIIKAMFYLLPNARCVISDDKNKTDEENYNNIQWLDEVNEKPTLAELVQADIDLDAFNINNEYSILRKYEYPPMEDYLDAIVKGDAVLQQEYIDACVAVKAKYPKPA